MLVKGISVKNTRDFVKTRFPNRYDEWLKSLPFESQRIYSTQINISNWYEIKAAYYDPMSRVADLLYAHNEVIAGDEMGRFSAEIALKGIYKVFLMVATPQYLMKKATMIMGTYYQPCEFDISESAAKHVILKISKFEGITRTLEYRFGGWCAKALELCNQKNISYRITTHLSAGQPSTTIAFRWQ
jgi:hypothetical protein